VSVELFSSLIFYLECLKRKHDTCGSRECGYNSIEKPTWKFILDNYLKPIVEVVKPGGRSSDVDFFESSAARLELWSLPEAPEEFLGKSSGFAAKSKAVLVDCLFHRSLKTISESDEYFANKAFVLNLVINSSVPLMSKTEVKDLEQKLIPFVLRLPVDVRLQIKEVFKFAFQYASCKTKLIEAVDLICLSEVETINHALLRIVDGNFQGVNASAVLDTICSFFDRTP
jgi:hypothetical protein